MEPSSHVSDDPAPPAAATTTAADDQAPPPLRKAKREPKALSKEQQDAILRSICASIGSGTGLRFRTTRRKYQQQQQQQPNIVARFGSSGKGAAASNRATEHALSRLESVSLAVRKECAIVRDREAAIAARKNAAEDLDTSGKGKKRKAAAENEEEEEEEEEAEHEQQQQRKKRITPADRRLKTQAHTKGMHFLPYRAALGRGASRISSRTVFPNSSMRRLLTSALARHLGIYEGKPDSSLASASSSSKRSTNKSSRASRYLRISPEAVNIIHDRAVAVLEEVIPLAEENAADAKRTRITAKDMMRAYMVLKLKGKAAPVILPSTVGFEPAVVKNARAKLANLKDKQQLLDTQLAMIGDKRHDAALTDERVTMAVLSNTISWHVDDHDALSDD
jgi:histone H3/H4